MTNPQIIDEQPSNQSSLEDELLETLPKMSGLERLRYLKSNPDLLLELFAHGDELKFIQILNFYPTSLLMQLLQSSNSPLHSLPVSFNEKLFCALLEPLPPSQRWSLFEDEALNLALDSLLQSDDASVQEALDKMLFTPQIYFDELRDYIKKLASIQNQNAHTLANTVLQLRRDLAKAVKKQILNHHSIRYIQATQNMGIVRETIQLLRAITSFSPAEALSALKKYKEKRILNPHKLKKIIFSATTLILGTLVGILSALLLHLPGLIFFALVVLCALAGFGTGFIWARMDKSFNKYRLFQSKITRDEQEIVLAAQSYQQNDLLEQECLIQIPSSAQILHTKGMCAGKDEDQFQRLTNMVEVITHFQEDGPLLPLIRSDQALSSEWTALFEAIENGDTDQALQAFQQIPSGCLLMRSLLAVHSSAYVQQIIKACIEAHQDGIKDIGESTRIRPQTFELLIKDIATTINNPAKLTFSFGLPTHHAFKDKCSGFCVFNKAAIILRHAELTHEQALQYVIVGTDVNRDNGLCSILMDSAADLDICHVDVFDSRVYPKQDFSTIDTQSGIEGQIGECNIACWQKDKLRYYAVDLSVTQRQDKERHPALVFALQQIKQSLETAKAKGQKTFIILPTGWDSHEDETAYCGKFVNGRMMEASEANKTRFNNEDLNYFYEQVFSLYNQNKEQVAGLYWGLEGGYDRAMYEQQIQLFLNQIARQVLHQELQLPTQNSILAI